MHQMRTGSITFLLSASDEKEYIRYMATLKNVFFAYLLDDTHYSIGEEMDDIIDNEVNDKYPIKQKIPSSGKEYLNFLPDEGYHIIYSLFYFSTLTVTPDLNRNSR